jgi:hypothetical protein
MLRCPVSAAVTGFNPLDDLAVDVITLTAREAGAAQNGASQSAKEPDESLDQQFRIDQHLHADGAVHLTLVGELDLAVADELGRRLGHLSSGHKRVMVELDRLTFMDSSSHR